MDVARGQRSRRRGRSIETCVDRGSDAVTESGWNAPAGTGSTALGAREPASPGSATRARVAVSTDPTTVHLGRTIGGERYRVRGPAPRPRCARRRGQRMTTSVLAGSGLDAADAVARSRRRSGPDCPRRPDPAASPRPADRPRSRTRAAPGRRSGRPRDGPARPSSGSTRNRLSRPMAGSAASAVHTANHSPVSSQRTSKSPMCALDDDLGGTGRPCRRARPAARDDPRPDARRPSSSTRTEPSQTTARVSVGSTTGRHVVEAGVSVPVAGSMVTVVPVMSTGRARRRWCRRSLPRD